MTEIRYCRDCKYSMMPGNFSERLRCMHHLLIREDPRALADVEQRGVSAASERAGPIGFGRCGVEGKLWEPK